MIFEQFPFITEDCLKEKPKINIKEGLKKTIEYFKIELNDTDFLY